MFYPDLQFLFLALSCYIFIYVFSFINYFTARMHTFRKEIGKTIQFYIFNQFIFRPLTLIVFQLFSPGPFGFNRPGCRLDEVGPRYTVEA